MVAIAKERGFDARFYGKMTFEMKLFQTATENDMVDSTFRFAKHQSLTMNEEQLIRTIQRMNSPVLQIEGEDLCFYHSGLLLVMHNLSI